MTDFMLDRTSTSTTEGVVDQLKHDNLKQAFEVAWFICSTMLLPGPRACAPPTALCGGTD